MTLNLLAYVKAPDGTRVLCEVKEIIPCVKTLLPMVAVQSLRGAPFNACNYAIVKMEDSRFTLGAG